MDTALPDQPILHEMIIVMQEYFASTGWKTKVWHHERISSSTIPANKGPKTLCMSFSACDDFFVLVNTTFVTRPYESVFEFRLVVQDGGKAGFARYFRDHVKEHTAQYIMGFKDNPSYWTPELAIAKHGSKIRAFIEKAIALFVCYQMERTVVDTA